MPEQADQPQAELSLRLIVTMSDIEHQLLSAHVMRLIDLDPPVATPAGIALQLLSYIVEQYELKRYPMREVPVPGIAAWPFPTGRGEPIGENMVG